MPVIKLWCLPSGQTEKYLKHLYHSIIEAVISVEELGIKSQKSITCLFPPDLMQYGLGEEIIIEIGGLYEKPGRTSEVRQRLAKNVGKAVKKIYPEARVECFVTTFNPAQGFWSSNDKPTADDAPKERDLSQEVPMRSGN